MRLQRYRHKLTTGIKVYGQYYLQRQTPVIIYSTGRVGSMALHHSLDAAGVLVFQVHILNPDEIAAKNPPGTTKWAYKHIISKQRPAKIISIVRDPLALMVSDFFPKLKWIADDPEAYKHHAVDELCEMFNTRYFEQGRHHEKLNWFEDHFESDLGIDVYAHPFSKEGGYTRFEHSPYDVLIFKLELDDATKSQLVAAFVGLDAFNIMRYNIGETKDYGAVYKQFKQQLRVRDEHLDAIYTSRYVRHFFTSDEIAALRARWC
ncbi:MAG: hypothetical protein CUN54_04455 [Phototrophicales bacterium]|nr:MAG: hypothetical protein CUN54_04455 [Phototrophicales bacterium]